MQHIIFDLDGTIIDSKGEIRKTYQMVIAKIKPSIETDLTHINFGATIWDVLKEVYGDEMDKIKQAKLAFSSIYDRSDYTETKLYNHVTSTLQHLKKSECKLYIATNKRLHPTMRILEKKKLLPFFSDIMASEMRPDENLSKDQMIAVLKYRFGFSNGYMIGDSKADIEAGQNQGLATIAVTYGYEKSDIFAALNPTHIIDSFDEITKII